MKCTIPEICWHSRDPVLSIDLQVGCHKTPAGADFWRLATGGADTHVLIWHLTLDKEEVASVTCVTDLEKHQRAVNIVRFSPSGEILASGDDESVIILWKAREESDIIPIFPGEENDNKEQWTYLKVLRGHIEDVLDLCWSIDSEHLVSGSVDNSVVLWNVSKGKKVATLSDYKGFVQGVAYDPLKKYVATLCTDRNLRLISVQNLNKVRTVQRVAKAEIPAPDGHRAEGKSIRLFYDDTFKSFFRRLTFTPDGSLIIAPSGIIEPMDSDEKLCNTTVMFSRHSLREPVAILPTFDETTIAVKCCPCYFKLREDGPKPMLDVPYRMVFAVATQHSVIIYDTQQLCPIAVISNIHYTRLTDAAWSSDGKILMVSSTDGYCTIICFGDGELGEVYKMPKSNGTEVEKTEKPVEKESSIPKPDLDMDCNAVDIDISEKITNGSKIIEDEKMEVTESESKAEETEDFDLVLEDTVAPEPKELVVQSPKTDKPIIKTPRRVQLITISSPKRAKIE